MTPSLPSPTIERSYNVSIDQLIEDDYWRRKTEYEDELFEELDDEFDTDDWYEHPEVEEEDEEDFI